jgi:sulfate-transporting ATPase
LVIVVMMAIRGTALPIRGFVGDRFAEAGAARVNIRVLVPVLAVLVALILTVFSVELADAVGVSLILALIMLSVVVLTGFAGQLSLAQFALAGIGAYAAGRLVATQGWPFELALVAGMVCAAVAGLVFALPALRARGVNLAVVTLGLGLAVQDLLFNNDQYTGGTDGTTVGGQTFFGIGVDSVRYPARYCVLALAAFVICGLIVANIRRSRAGRRLLAVRANERAAAALGVSVFGAKMYAFAVSAAIAGLGGALLGFRQHTILYGATFDPISSILTVAYSVIGGVGYISGALFGSQFVSGGLGSYVADKILGGIDTYLQLIGGVSVIILILQAPDGFAGTLVKHAAWLRRRLGRRRAGEATQPLSASQPATIDRVQPCRLRVSGLTVRFGTVTAVNEASLHVDPGEVVGLIGPNGAGKTTLIDAVTGFVPCADGVITIDDREMNDWSVWRRARAGIARSFQSLELFEDLTLRENLLVASDERDALGYIVGLAKPDGQRLPAATQAIVDEFNLESELDLRPPDISYGRRRLVAIARAVAPMPSILLLDEPSAGLNSYEGQELSALVRKLAADWGIGVLLVEHDMNVIMTTCSRIVVLDSGTKIAEGTPDQVQADPAVIAAYLGTPEATLEV